MSEQRDSVRYYYGHNVTRTGQHEVLELVTLADGTRQGPYLTTYTVTDWAAYAIAAILNADGEEACLT